MHQVFTKAKGAEIQVGNFGCAKNDAPALVPAAVAQELAEDRRFRIVAPEGRRGREIEAQPDDAPMVKAEGDEVAGPFAEAALAAYHAAGGKVYHDDPACTDGNDIERKNRRKGTGGKPPCSKCVHTPAAPPAEVKEG